MASAKKCDRCGTLYETYNERNSVEKPNGIMLLNIDGNQQYFSHAPLDLCPACMGWVQRFMKLKTSPKRS